jgi:hypothetical protein
VGTRKPDGYRFGQNFKPIMGTGFLMGVWVWAKFQTHHGYEFFNGCKHFSRVWV